MDQSVQQKGNWRIECEIPPLRAIYHAEAHDCTKSEATEAIKAHQPLWRIRKIELLPCDTTPKT
jgi:hypothetical protein